MTEGRLANIARNVAFGLMLSPFAWASAQDPEEPPPMPDAPQVEVEVPPPAIQEILEDEEQIFLGRIRPVLLAELNVIRQACKPPKEQQASIDRAAAAIMIALLGEYQHQKPTAEKVELEGQAAPGPNYRKSIQDHILKHVIPILTDDQRRLYAAEKDRRDASHRRVVLRMILAELDQRLFLGQAQHAAIEKELSGHMTEPWWPSLFAAMEGDEKAWEIPDKHILPFLTQAQKAVWDDPEFNLFQNGLGGPYDEVVAIMSDLHVGKPAKPVQAPAPPALEPQPGQDVTP
ncbi:hypothetical protein [Singulisphaera sp. PoT]|uniref:hypothetical protein n=1 Tax=Singulisphaera sp. PoT TaxID=3411797 RepID=UPI003BF4D9EC